MKRMILWMLTLITVGMCHAEDVAIHYNGASAKVKNKAKDSVTVTINGADINIESLYTKHQLTLRLSGMSDNGRLMLKSVGKAKITLDGLTLTSQEGAPLWLKNKKNVLTLLEGDGDFNLKIVSDPLEQLVRLDT